MPLATLSLAPLTWASGTPSNSLYSQATSLATLANFNAGPYTFPTLALVGTTASGDLSVTGFNNYPAPNSSYLTDYYFGDAHAETAYGLNHAYASAQVYSKGDKSFYSMSALSSYTDTLTVSSTVGDLHITDIGFYVNVTGATYTSDTFVPGTVVPSATLSVATDNNAAKMDSISFPNTSATKQATQTYFFFAPVSNNQVTATVSLTAEADILASAYEGKAVSDFSDTGTLSGIEFFNANHQVVPAADYVLTSASGTTYPSSPVPEASTLVSTGLFLALGLGGMVVAIHKRKAKTE